MHRFVIEGGRPLKGDLYVGGSKNATLPLMAAALLGTSPTTLRRVPDLRDVRTMINVLVSVGAEVSFDQNVMKIDPAGFNKIEAPYDIVRRMRASIYVMGPMLGRLRQAKVSLPGGCAIGPRPIDLHLKGFEHLGAEVRLEHGYVIADASNGLKGEEFNLSGNAGSSVGATCNVVMAAALAKGTTTIHGSAREPDVCELCEFLNLMGAKISGIGTGTITIEGVESLNGIDHTVISDRIEAGTFIAAVAITGGDVLVHDCPTKDMTLTLDKFREIGVGMEINGNDIHVTGEPSGFRPTNIQTAVYPGFPTDMQAQFMALLAVVKGTSVITEGIYVDRFMHAPELNRMGADIDVAGGKAVINGVDRLMGAPVMASDLRASAALVVAALAAEGETQVNRIYHIDRGYEQIERKLSAVGASIYREGEITEGDWGLGG